MIATQPTHGRLIRLREVEHIAGIRRSTIYKLAGDGRFPRPVHLGARAVAWVEDEVHAWINARVGERDALAA